MKGIQLAQSRPTDTTAVSVYSPDGGEVVNIVEIIVCNTTTASATYKIFHDEDGTDYDEDTALFFDTPLTAKSTDIHEVNWWMRNEDGNLAVEQGTASACTFTFTGIIQSE